MRKYAAQTSTMIKPLLAGSDDKPKQIIWGDWLDVDVHPSDAGKYVVHWRSRTGKVTDYVIDRAATQDTPLLEIVFMDVGQGDGCFVAIPDGEVSKLLLIDAGSAKGNNLYRFLRWRHKVIDSSGKFHAAIITHPDEDHYGGFQKIFDDQDFSFDAVYHNGLVERDGPPDDDNIGERGGGYCLEVFETAQAARKLLEDEEARGRRKYPKLLWTALSDSDRFGDVSLLAVDKGAAPQFMDNLGGEVKIEVIGPLIERDDNNKARLRQFGQRPGDDGFNKGKTKNGHSVLLRLVHANLTLIFGGDLNRPAEDFLLRHYGKLGPDDALSTGIAEARKRLSADLLKCCHHGSADVTDEFLEAVNAMGYVVSSGDGESHVHPRPEVLGLLGKQGKGRRPLVLCTEILRSTPEALKLSAAEEKKLVDLRKAISSASSAATRKTATAALEKFYEQKMSRLVEVYGAINLRSDGESLLVGFLKEMPSPSGKRWHTYLYKHMAGGWKLEGEDTASH